MTDASLIIKVDSTQAATAEKTLASLAKTGQSTEQSTSSLTQSAMKLAAAYVSLNTVTAGFRQFLNTVTETERLRGSLETMTGSAENATRAFDNLTEFAARTPFTLDQSVNAFIKLKALGLDPSERALTSYGNTASAMGKTMTQMIEAVADASTMQFERLKEFGIKAAQEGDQVSFTFQGVTTTVRKNAAEIEEYLMKIGETKFGDAMSNQMDRLPGKLSNLEDATAGLWRTIGDAGATDALIAGINGSITAIEFLTRVIRGNTNTAEAQSEAFDKVRASLGRLTQDELVKNIMAVQAQMDATRADIKEKEKLLTTLHPLSDAHKSVSEQIRLSNEQLKMQISNQQTLTDQLRRVQSGWKENTSAISENTSAVSGNSAATESFTRATQVASGAIATLNTEAWRAAAAFDGVAAASKAAGASVVADVKDWEAAVNMAGKSVTKTNADAAKQSADEWRDFRNSVSDAFADMILDGESAGDAIVASFKRTFAKILADFAVSGIAGMFTGKGLSGFDIGGAIAGAGTSGKILSSVLGGGGAAITASQAAALNLPASAAGGGIGAAVTGGLKSVAAGAGNLISAIPGWGWALGAAALAVSQLDKSTPSHNAGLLIHDVPGAKADQKFDVPAFASGFDPVGFARRENQAAANQVIDVFRQDDAVLTELARAAGYSVNFNASTFRSAGTSETGTGDGVFLGSAREEGGGSGRSIDENRTAYVSAFIKGLSSQIGAAATADILSAGSADAMINRAAELVAGKTDGSHATGLDYVPFDGYRATLHQGERVQTAAQARSDDTVMSRLLGVMESMRSELAVTAAATKRTADLLRRVTRDGDSLITEAA